MSKVVFCVENVSTDAILEKTLYSIAYFEDLEGEEIENLVAAAITRSYPANKTIFHEGDTASGLWIVLAGRIKISKFNMAGSEYILHILGTGDTFNDVATLDGGNNPANAIALSDVSLSMIPAQFITDLIATNGTFALRVARILSQRVRLLVGQIEGLALYPVMIRLARFLLQQMQDPSLSGTGITRTVIAAHLATTPQTISNVLRELEGLGVIKFDRHRIWIVNEDELRTISML